MLALHLVCADAERRVRTVRVRGTETIRNTDPRDVARAPALTIEVSVAGSQCRRRSRSVRKRWVATGGPIGERRVGPCLALELFDRRGLRIRGFFTRGEACGGRDCDEEYETAQSIHELAFAVSGKNLTDLHDLPHPSASFEEAEPGCSFALAQFPTSTERRQEAADAVGGLCRPRCCRARRERRHQDGGCPRLATASLRLNPSFPGQLLLPASRRSRPPRWYARGSTVCAHPRGTWGQPRRPGGCVPYALDPSQRLGEAR